MSQPDAPRPTPHHLLSGRIRHVRHTPIHHAFGYDMRLLEIDLDQLDSTFGRHWLWGLDHPAVASFHQDDHLGGGPHLAERARALIQSRLGFRPTGHVRLICQPRYFGYGFNPVTFYLFGPANPDAAGAIALEAIALEVTNTPWNERHVYVLDCRHAVGGWRFETEKTFHVSPFMPMDLQYRFEFDLGRDHFHVTKMLLNDGQEVFRATLDLVRSDLTRRDLTRLAVACPPRSMRTMGAIYWQALRLWWRGATYHAHPGTVRSGPQDSGTSEIKSSDK